ncbi:hypothetical protein CDL15_Pgr005754 [Punica granatum]|nr:hypothetical protein CDL15_Pgr005754 [Punica granatum]
MEKVSIRSRSSQAKIIGTIVSMSGALMITLYQGPAIIFRPKPSLSLKHSLHSLQSSNWTIGGVLLFAEYFLVTLWYTFQSHIMKEYPSQYTVIFYYDVVVSCITSIVGIYSEPNPNAWRVRGVGLASVIFSGLFNSCINNCAYSWLLGWKGPFYVAMFKPISIAIAVAMGVVFLGDPLHLGSLIGATIISIGFYTVMWGKVKEENEMVEENGASSTGSGPDHKVPLLQNSGSHKV